MTVLSGILSATLGASAAAAATDRAPQWLADSEIYALYYSADPPSAQQIEQLATFPLVIWGQPSKHVKVMKALQRRGVRSIAYVSFYKGPDITRVEDRRHWQGGSPGVREVGKNPFWRALNRSKHPEWTLIGEDGSVKRPFDNPNYPPGWDQVCTNVAGYRDAALRGARAMMDLRFDGLFIDNVHPSDCFGPQHGHHAHVQPALRNIETYKFLITEVRQVVKSYGDDKVCVLNSGTTDSEYAPHGDAMMWEPWIDGWTTDKWAAVQQGAVEWRPYVESGKPILAVTHAGHGQQLDHAGEASYLSYACAKLAGFLWGNDPLVLAAIRLGKPIAEAQVADGVHYRLFEHGLVAVNPEAEERHATIPIGTAHVGEAFDRYAAERLPITDGTLQVRIRGGSGRVYLFTPPAPSQ